MVSCMQRPGAFALRGGRCDRRRCWRRRRPTRRKCGRPGRGRVEAFEHQDCRAFGQDKAVPTAVKRPAGALRLVVACRQGAHRGKAADADRGDRGLGPAHQHHVSPGPDHLHRVADGLGARGAAPRGVHAGPGADDAQPPGQRLGVASGHERPEPLPALLARACRQPPAWRRRRRCRSTPPRRAARRPPPAPPAFGQASRAATSAKLSHRSMRRAWPRSTTRRPVGGGPAAIPGGQLLGRRRSAWSRRSPARQRVPGRRRRRAADRVIAPSPVTTTYGGHGRIRSVPL